MMRKPQTVLFAATFLFCLGIWPAPVSAGGNTAESFSQSANTADNRYCSRGNIPRFGTNDGPAQLPQSCFYTALDGTPSPNPPLNISAGADLQAALNAAKCGDVLKLTPDSAYSFSSLPAKHCDDDHWITVRSAAADADLPPEGTRVTPCYAGVAQLPGRPPFHCVALKNVLARIEVKPNSVAPSVAGDHVRFIGIEFMRTPGGWVEALATMSGGNKIIFDRTWFHGNATEETTRGLDLSGSTFVAVIDSYFSDFHCLARTGACTDSQAIAGGFGTSPSGTWKIVNNFLESAAENLLFGGSAATIVPADIEIRRNDLFKPMIWNPADPSFFGTTFSVKNHFELKNATRVLFEGNIMQNVWGGFSQGGAHVLLTPKNQSNGILSLCPVCEVSNVTIRYSHATRGYQELQIANTRSDNGGYAKAGYGYSIHDVVFDHQQYGATCYKCGNYMNQISSVAGVPASLLLHDVKIDHLTIASDTEALEFLILAGPTPPVISNIEWTNSIFPAGNYGVWTAGGADNCATHPAGNSPKGKFDACWSHYLFTGNVIVGGDSISGQETTWPRGNVFVSSPRDVFGKTEDTKATDFRVASGKLKNKATDGRDPGADIDAVERETRGVE